MNVRLKTLVLVSVDFYAAFLAPNCAFGLCTIIICISICILYSFVPGIDTLARLDLPVELRSFWIVTGACIICRARWCHREQQLSN